MFGVNGNGDVGIIKALMSGPGGHTEAVWAQLAADRIVGIAATADPAIAEQARAFKLRLTRVIEYYIGEAKREQAAYIAAELAEHGYSEAAAYVRARGS